MGTSVFIAKIMGPYFLLIALSIVVNRGFFQQLMEDYCKSHILILFGGMLAFVFGLVVVQVHNIWVSGWPVLITILGWSSIVKGMWLILFPNSLSGLMQLYIRNRHLLMVNASIAFILGAILSICGYFCA